MNIKYEKRVLLSMLGIGLIIAGGYVRTYSDLGILMIQIGIGILMYMPFCDRKFSLLLVGVLLLLWNAVPFLARRQPFNAGLYMSIAIIVAGIVFLCHSSKKEKESIG